MSEDTRVSAGKRIKYDIIEGQEHIWASHKMYSDGVKMVRIILNLQEMTYKFVDPVTGKIHESGGGVTNLEVLQRKAKRNLKKFLGIYFEHEYRNVKRS